MGQGQAATGLLAVAPWPCCRLHALDALAPPPLGRHTHLALVLKRQLHALPRLQLSAVRPIFMPPASCWASPPAVSPPLPAAAGRRRCCRLRVEQICRLLHKGQAPASPINAIQPGLCSHAPCRALELTASRPCGIKPCAASHMLRSSSLAGCSAERAHRQLLQRGQRGGWV